MDELPQFLNILRGDMSFVGPRALAVGENLIDENGQPIRYETMPDFHSRLSVRPGLTGMATIYIPKDSPPATKLEYDLRYISQQSFWLDLRLILLSLWISLRGRWESRDHKL
jgi:lipopolysaccharide/colanic/teichoic acid biosynthesis glycosyltransferase